MATKPSNCLQQVGEMGERKLSGSDLKRSKDVRKSMRRFSLHMERCKRVDFI